MLKKVILVLILMIGFVGTTLFLGTRNQTPAQISPWWKIQSIDTMKYSRDLARERLRDASFNSEIEKQVKNIADTGATHIAIATPYDDEFYPFLKRWVDVARSNNLKVWFRGNWSGWEEWFDYPEITRAEHMAKTEEFILENRTLFVHGDIFTACPECENGGPGDPRLNDDLDGHRKFLIDEYNMMENAFRHIGKSVIFNYNSMNGDVARLVMDRKTTAALGGVVVIDHYVETPKQLIDDIKDIASESGGKIVLGEFGAPIPDIHGIMTDEEQAIWLEEALIALADTEEVIGMNYWTNTGSSTELWRENGNPRAAATTLSAFYNTKTIKGRVVNEAGGAISGAYITIDEKRYFTDQNGYFEAPYFDHITNTRIDAQDYQGLELEINNDEYLEITLVKTSEDLWFVIRKFIHNLLSF